MLDENRLLLTRRPRRLTERQIEEQEHLSDEFLKIVSGSVSRDPRESPRPLSSLPDLMSWVQKVITTGGYGSGYDEDSTVIVNNKILIDGAFLTFCNESKTRVHSTRPESLITWKTQHGFEHFIAQGIFRIDGPEGLDFIQATLMHKGNQGEDEISYFVVVPNSRVRQYINFRNAYVDWTKDRERSSSEVEVIGGDSVLYECDLGWDDLFLPDKEKGWIRTSVEGFMKSREKFIEKKVPWKRGLIFWGPRGCGKTMTLKVIMSVYEELKPVTIQGNHPNLDEVIEEAFAYAHEHSPSLLFFEDIQELAKRISLSHFLQMLDGIQTKEGALIIATGNDLKFIEENLTDRPRRFDRVIEFPLPTKELARAYLEKWFGDIVTQEDYEKIVGKAVNHGFTYSHLQELYFLSVFYAVQNDREDPNRDDVMGAFEEILEGKKQADRGFTTKQKRSITDYGKDYRP